MDEENYDSLPQYVTTSRRWFVLCVKSRESSLTDVYNPDDFQSICTPADFISTPNSRKRVLGGFTVSELMSSGLGGGEFARVCRTERPSVDVAGPAGRAVAARGSQ